MHTASRPLAWWQSAALLIPLLANSTQAAHTGMADPAALTRSYAAQLAAAGANRGIAVYPLTALPGYTAGNAAVDGMATIDHSSGRVSATVRGMPVGEQWTLWAIGNRPGLANGTLPDAGDRMVALGTFSGSPALARLEATNAELRDFIVDRTAVTQTGRPPHLGFLATGAPPLWQRLLLTRGERFATADAEALLIRGRTLFLRETFTGNGRTCGSCHAESGNFTIAPRDLAALPPSDPLFVSDRDAGLGPVFERTGLLRLLGLVTVNADGFEDLGGKFTLRAVPSLLGIATTTRAPAGPFFVDFTGNGQNPNPPERLGWSNDAPALREFALGAIHQHMTRNIARRVGTDFRVPTDEELDALAAYQAFAGRQEDLDLTRLRLRVNAGTRGQRLFLDTGTIGEPGHKNCNACHFNAGGTVAFALNPDAPGFSPRLDGNPRGFNGAAGINTGELPLGAALPRDGGFGRLRLPNGAFGNFGEIPGFGTAPVEEFATQSLVEAADTAPYFHNHAAATLEEAIAFYGSAAYRAINSVGGPLGFAPVTISSDPQDREVQTIAAFLRVLSALDNIRSAIGLAERARAARDREDARELAQLAAGEVRDARSNLSEGLLGRSRERQLIEARAHLTAAEELLGSGIEAAAPALRRARAALAMEDTLPASYRR